MESPGPDDGVIGVYPSDDGFYVRVDVPSRNYVREIGPFADYETALLAYDDLIDMAKQVGVETVVVKRDPVPTESMN